MLFYHSHHIVATDSSIEFVWPSEKFEYQQRQIERDDWAYDHTSSEPYPPGWWFGTYHSCHIGVYCNASSVDDQTGRDDFKEVVILYLTSFTHTLIGSSNPGRENSLGNCLFHPLM